MKWAVTMDPMARCRETPLDKAPLIALAARSKKKYPQFSSSIGVITAIHQRFVLESRTRNVLTPCAFVKANSGFSRVEIEVS